ncbi:hypothetical protein VB715_02975 [Crocosphaera sp. UHCC 0190]|uniref:hypothetical protein n=1 Tax=Crocosphaera sp. UHCC 0190 TaxID=3110246 RepID=UPI002B21E394|nr:hypothetical protein [Crocosphaera sp. UHCC 0190]MEA5508719.1 hypothetical protein [Crocosphaera sp. UHCC 0190]
MTSNRNWRKDQQLTFYEIPKLKQSGMDMNTIQDEIDLEIVKRDVNHIQAEMRQLRNQQFLITTAGLTIFGVVTSWIIKADSPLSGTKDVRSVHFLLESLLLTILFILFLWSQQLKNLLATLAAYLRTRGWSYWEVDYKKYTKDNPYISQTRLVSIVFLVLGLLSFLFCFLNDISLPWDEGTKWGEAITVVIFVLYLIFICGMGFCGWWFSDKQVQQRWDGIIDKKNPKNQ